MRGPCRFASSATTAAESRIVLTDGRCLGKCVSAQPRCCALVDAGVTVMTTARLRTPLRTSKIADHGVQGRHVVDFSQNESVARNEKRVDGMQRTQSGVPLGAIINDERAESQCVPPAAGPRGGAAGAVGKLLVSLGERVVVELDPPGSDRAAARRGPGYLLFIDAGEGVGLAVEQRPERIAAGHDGNGSDGQKRTKHGHGTGRGLPHICTARRCLYTTGALKVTTASSPNVVR